MQKNWNLKLLYSSIDDKQIENDIQKSKEQVKLFVDKWKENKEYLNNPKTLSIALKEYESLMEDPGICTKPSYYIFLLRSLNQQDPELKARENLLHRICLELENSIQFFTINISKIEKEKQEMFLKSPHLVKYKHFLKTSFDSARYVLSDKEEKIFNLQSKTSYSNWVDMTSQLLSKQTLKVIDQEGDTLEVLYSEVSKYLDSRNKKVRDSVAKEFYDINKKYSEIAEFEINSILENKKTSDNYRGIKNPDTIRLLGDDMEKEVVDTLRETVTKNFDISQRFYKLKAKILNQKNLSYYERNVKLGEIEKEYPFEESISLVKETFDKIDMEFKEILDKFINIGTYDVYPAKSKQGGAFCVSVGSKYPTYILLNHNNQLQDILTIAHESGHGIHTQYSNTQNPLNQGYSTACAEVASTFFEDFVLESLSKGLGKNEKDLLLFKSLEDDISTIFRQIACYNFELELHKQYNERGYLASYDVSKIFVSEMTKYLGPFVLKDKHMELGWIYWSHIRSFFYTYSYASGQLISKYLQNIVRENQENIGLVKDFFKAGDSKSPKDIFFDMRVDISKKDFWEKGIQSIEEKLSYLEKEL